MNALRFVASSLLLVIFASVDFSSRYPLRKQLMSILPCALRFT
jgi:hypothetical protein